MPSSTFSSSKRGERPGPIELHRMELLAAPPAMLRSVLVALLIAGMLLGALEAVLRREGIHHSVADDKDLWCYERDRVPHLVSEDVVLLGGSRMQLDFALDTFRRRFPDRHVVQLAIDGSIPFAALADISVHTGFAGTVLCDVRADCMTAYGTPSDVQSQYVRYHDREWGLNRRANRFLSSQAQQRLAIVNPALGLNGLIKGALARGWQRPLYYTRADRETFFDYALMPAPVRRGLEAYDANTVRQARATYDRRGRAAWEADADRIAALARNIRARGGRVIFARFPTSGEVRQQEDRLFPGAAFWEPFIHRTGVVGLNYADSPALTRFQCPEGSHLDYREAASFTERLWDEIEARQGRRASDFPGF